MLSSQRGSRNGRVNRQRWPASELGAYCATHCLPTWIFARVHVAPLHASITNRLFPVAPFGRVFCDPALLDSDGTIVVNSPFDSGQINVNVHMEGNDEEGGDRRLRGLHG